jgi:hypothetical protein
LELPAALEAAGPFTIELWMNPLEAASRNIFRTQVPDAGEAVALSFYAKEAPMFSAGRGKSWSSAVGQPIAAGWQHVACIYSGTEVRIYQNGKLTGNGEVKEPLTLPGQPLWIGDCGLPTSAFRGRVNEVRISRGELYTKEFQPPRRLTADQDSLALYHCDEGAGEEVKDSSGNNRHAKVSGATWISAQTGQPLSP